MNTDKQLFQLFSVRPSWLFELARLKPPKRCQFRPFTIKSLERRLDGLIVPADPREPLWITEFQFCFDRSIYTRIITEMCAVQEAFKWRAVRGLIFFGEQQHDPRVEPWTQVVDTFVLRDLLKSFRESNPTHPLNAVFHPLIEPREDVLEAEAVADLRLIRQSSFGDRDKEAMETVFLDWIQQRFKDRSQKEFEKMLIGELTPLEETRVAKEFIEMGKQIGLREGKSQGLSQGIQTGQSQALQQAIAKVITARFREVPRTILSRAKNMQPEQQLELLSVASTCGTVAEIREWLRSHPAK